jgi:hypothetical protein
MGLILEDLDQLLVPLLSDGVQKRVVGAVAKANHARTQSQQILEAAEERLIAAPWPCRLVSTGTVDLRLVIRFGATYQAA